MNIYLIFFYGVIDGFTPQIRASKYSKPSKTKNYFKDFKEKYSLLILFKFYL